MTPFYGAFIILLGALDLLLADWSSRMSFKLERLVLPEREKPSILARANTYRAVGVLLIVVGCIATLAKLGELCPAGADNPTAAAR